MATRLPHEAPRHAAWQPFIVAIILYALNNLAVITGLLYADQDDVPTLMYRTEDIACYLTWIGGYRAQNLIPNYHVPWQTGAAYLSPMMWLIARLASGFDLPVPLVYHAIHFGLYVAASFGLFSALSTFMATKRQRCLAGLCMALSVPIGSLLFTPVAVARYAGWQALPRLPGLGDYVWWSSDGFLHGISGSMLVTFGTASSIWVLDRLGRYLRTGARVWLWQAALLTAVSAFVHPFEVLVILTAGTMAMLLWRRTWTLALPDVLLLGGFAGLGLLPAGVLSLRHPWLQEVARSHAMVVPNLLRLLMILGIPAMMTIYLLARRARWLAGTDLLLQCWFLSTLLCTYLPWPNWQHMLDGFHVVNGLLLVRLVVKMPRLPELVRRRPWLVYGLLGVWGALSITPVAAYYVQNARDGAASPPEALLTTVAPRDEVQTLAWFRQNAASDEVVLAPKEHAPWLATVPMHSVASHWMFSLTYDEQAQRRDAFYAGILTGDAVEALWQDYRVRYVVMPEDSPARAYVDDARRVAVLGSLTIYDLGGQLSDLRAGVVGSSTGPQTGGRRPW